LKLVDIVAYIPDIIYYNQWVIYFSGSTKYLGEYTLKQTRTLQRRIAQWRLDQGSQEEKMREIMTTETPWPALPIEIVASQPRVMTAVLLDPEWKGKVTLPVCEGLIPSSLILY